MAFNFSTMVTFTPEFTTVQQAVIRFYMQKAYDGSTIAKNMFDNWGRIIKIQFLQDDFRAVNSVGILKIDPTFLNGLSYINDQGMAVSYSIYKALIHELGHALNGTSDNLSSTDYLGDNARFVNTIWEQLNLGKMISYTSAGKEDTQRTGYNYTNLSPIDSAFNVEYLKFVNWSTALLGLSRDLIIGGPSPNVLESGAGDDFLFGGGGNDTLNGGTGIDTAVYFGSPSDYDIRKNTNGTWTVRDKRWFDNAGTDTLKNIEFLQFDNNKKYELKAGGLTFQSDIAFVIDTTGSTGLYGSGPLNYIQQQASSLVDAIFADDQDARVGIVGFKDTTNGEPSQVILPFTEQDEFADRKSAAIAAINSITVGGGGDIPETAFDGLRLALKGALGEWRPGAGAIRVVLFTNSSVKDYAILNEVTALAQNIGASVGTTSSGTVPGGYVDTFGLNLGGSVGVPNIESPIDDCGGFGCYLTGDVSNIPFVPSNEPIDIIPMTVQVQIFTVFTGPANTDTRALEAISTANGGSFQTAATNDDLLKKLIAIVGAPQVDRTPTISVITTASDAAETKTDEIAYPGQFTLTRTDKLTEALTVTYTLSGTATNSSDYQNLTGTVTFEPGKDKAIVALNPLDDNIFEGNETVTLTIIDGGTNYKLDATAQTGTITIIDNDTRPQISINNISQAEGNTGTSNFGFNITLSNPSIETVAVTYSTANGTATVGSDYTATTGTVTFNPGETSKTVSVSVTGDTTLERDETFNVNLTNPTGSTIDRATGIGTILDDDRPTIDLTVNDADAAELKRNPGQFTLTRNSKITNALTVNYTIAGTATNDLDYKKLTGTATFKAGSAQTTIDISPIDDKLYEDTETVVLSLTDGGTFYKVNPTVNTGTVTITDNDLPSISIEVTDDKAAETKIGESINPGRFTLKRTGWNASPLTVNYTLDGTAINSIDYLKIGNSITFTAGNDTATIDINPIDDNLLEGKETVILKLSQSNNYTIDEDKSGKVTITDNDTPRNWDDLDESDKLVLKIQSINNPIPAVVTGLQGTSEGKVIDLRGFVGKTFTVDTKTVGDADYKNYIGFYVVEDTQGTLANGLKPSDAGYAEAAIRGVILSSSINENKSDLMVAGGKILAPVVIASGTFENYLKQNPQNKADSNIHAYFNYIGANTDKVDHFRLLGDNKFGVEDMYGGGDRDYNDLVFQLTVKS